MQPARVMKIAAHVSRRINQTEFDAGVSHSVFLHIGG